MAERRTVEQYQKGSRGAEPDEEDADYSSEVTVDQSAPQSEGAPAFEVCDQFGVRDLADAIIADAHPDLTGANILYLFEQKEHKSSGRVSAGRVLKLGPLDRFLESGKLDVEAGADFLVVIARSVWLAHTQPRWREGLLDSLLSRCVAETNEDGNTVYGLRKPEIQEFAEVIRRRGLWNEDLRNAGEIVRQLPLALPVGAA